METITNLPALLTKREVCELLDEKGVRLLPVERADRNRRIGGRLGKEECPAGEGYDLSRSR